MSEFPTENPVEEYCRVLHEIYGIFHDGRMGFGRYKKYLESFGPSSSHVVYENGEPGKSGSLLLHHSTKDDIEDRNRPDGKNCCLLGNYCLVMIYSHWEDRYRREITKMVDPKEVTLIENSETREQLLGLDIFGDIKNYRNEIIHNKRIAGEESRRNKILRFFDEGNEIMIDTSKMEEIVSQILIELKKLRRPNGKRLYWRNPISYTYKFASIFDP